MGTAKYYVFKDEVVGKNDFFLGKGRFAAEVFVGTHPGLVPCGKFWNVVWSVDNPKWKKLPLSEKAIPPPSRNFTILPGLEVTDWHLLPGLLWRYYRLYGEMPPSDSWVWENFPDGKRWKDAVEKIGFPRALHYRITT